MLVAGCGQTIHPTAAFLVCPPLAVSLPGYQVKEQQKQSSGHTEATYALMNLAESSQKDQTKEIGCWKLYKSLSV